MEEQFTRFTNIGHFMNLYGQELVFSLAILVFGLIAVRFFTRFFKTLLQRMTKKEKLTSAISNALHVLLVALVIAVALQYAGANPLVIRRAMVTISLAVVGLIIIFKPYIPTLPFKVGNTILTGDLLGKVEAITVLNTRLKTFNGRTVFVPNRKILDDYVINYHFTPSRRFELEVGIGYDQDLLKAKQILEAILIEDPRVLTKPRPVVYVLNLADSCVELSARGWAENLKYWRTKCDLLEKAKLRLDAEGIKIAFPQRDIHFYNETPAPTLTDAEDSIVER